MLGVVPSGGKAAGRAVDVGPLEHAVGGEFRLFAVAGEVFVDVDGVGLDRADDAVEALHAGDARRVVGVCA